jgi:hypothetical protein
MSLIISCGVRFSGNISVASYGVSTAPTIGTAYMSSATTAVVPFTAPIDSVLPITSYTAVSTPGGITGTLNQSDSGSVIVNGLSSTTVYTFVVYATSGAGNSPTSARSNIVWPYGYGQAIYNNTG